MPAPANIYENDVDFTSLSLQYPDFAKQLKPNRQLDFSDPESVRQLTKSLLHRDFDLTVTYPTDRLCPTVPNRFNYILFIQRLLDCTSPDFREGYDPDRRVIGLDIGTGCVAIYPLLACRHRAQWRFLFTEIDEKNRKYAQDNIQRNGLQNRIRGLDTDATGQVLIPATQLRQVDRIDILVTNPPFYDSEASLLDSAKQKSRPANSSCTGTAVEMITPGGEVAFVTQLIVESSRPALRRKIQWFSAMLGKLSSVGTVVDKLRQEGCTNHAVTEFIQGERTRRWCVAWSWIGLRPSTGVARGIGGGSGVEKKYLPAVTEMEFEVEAAGDARDVGEKISSEIKKLDGVLWKLDAVKGIGMFMAKTGDVWSRKARRKTQAQQEAHADHDGGRLVNEQNDTEMKDRDSQGNSSGEEEEEEQPEPALVTRISVTCASTASNRTTNTGTSNRASVLIRHLQGHDSVLFESFCGWLKRKVLLNKGTTSTV